jgi:photosystem II stability/assembly factor-like uncharacterized protein
MKKIILIFFIIHCTLIIAEAQWFTQQSGTTNPLYDIEFINKNTGWACGDDGIIKTTNGGVNWIRQSNGVPNEPLFGIDPVDSNIVYAVGFFRTFIKTTNGGSSWFSLDSGTVGDGTYTYVFFINQNTGWIGNFESGGYGIKKTTDGGRTLTLNFLNEFPNDLFFKDSLNGMGVQGSALTFKTTNVGTSWSVNQLAGSGNFYRVSFINDNTGYTASTRAVYKTTNFGITWDSVGLVTPLNIDVTSIEFSNENTGWAGTQYQMYKTTNSGRNWLIQSSTLIGVIYSICSYNDSLVWSCGNGGRIWHTLSGGDTLTLIKQISNSIPESFELKQNYPNPFNPETTIEFSIRKTGKYKMEIYNNLGQIMDAIFENHLTIGKYKVIYNAEKLTSGIYYYRLSGEELSIGKKFLLIK